MGLPEVPVMAFVMDTFLERALHLGPCTPCIVPLGSCSGGWSRQEKSPSSPPPAKQGEQVHWLRGQRSWV